MPKITPKAAPLRNWFFALLLLAGLGAGLGAYAAMAPKGIDSVLDLLTR